MTVIVLAIDSVIQGTLTTGAMIACTILVWRVLSPFQMLCNALARYEQLFNAIETRAHNPVTRAYRQSELCQSWAALHQK